MDRFDLEDKITAINNIVEELNTLSKLVLEHDIDKDDIASTLFGIKMLHEGRQAELFDVFTQVFELDEYANVNKNKCADKTWTYCGYSENTNPSIDLDFNGIKNCSKRNFDT